VPFSSIAIAVSAAGSGSSSSKGGGLTGLVPFLLIAVVGYLLLVRPARARQRAALQNRQAIEPGVEVTTTAGQIGTVVAVDDDTVTLEIAPGVQSRFVKAAIGRVNTPPEPEPPAEDAAGDEADPSGETPAGTGA
jgi:preprotein translocase subunit YajC